MTLAMQMGMPAAMTARRIDVLYDTFCTLLSKFKQMHDGFPSPFSCIVSLPWTAQLGVQITLQCNLVSDFRFHILPQYCILQLRGSSERDLNAIGQSCWPHMP